MIWTVEHPASWPNVGLINRLNRIGAMALARLDWPEGKLRGVEAQMLRAAMSPDIYPDPAERLSRMIEATARILTTQQSQIGSSARETIMGVMMVRRALQAGADELSLSVAISLGMTAMATAKQDDEREVQEFLAEATPKLRRALLIKEKRAANMAAQNQAVADMWQPDALAFAIAYREVHPYDANTKIVRAIEREPSILNPSPTRVAEKIADWIRDDFLKPKLKRSKT